MSTPHISANVGDFAETVLMPGDPLRAQYIAENFLDDAVQVTGVRNMYGFTGTYKGKPVSIMGSGMGIPSMSIYARELIVSFGVKNIIRIGTCGGIGTDIKIRDVIFAQGASTDSNVNRARVRGYDFSAIANFDLLLNGVNAAQDLGIKAKVGNVFTTDTFYQADDTFYKDLDKLGVLAVDMETAGLYGVAAEYGANAMALFTVSDHVITGEATPADERQSTFNEMVKIALESI
ncbi:MULTISPECIES: purine-nucleoside phosphorylase [unclassified Pseudoalteromonas]|uniref:purine-nucleoside phosphorylase n=1 Tax=unclassified Pseudoalteromonas TaxID=194690 RepID=UPI0023597E16|nr:MULTISPECIES: purine-nucleoside phosphorylase [unclassified Pseudoalteromonas]MDC9566760.1 purine-nucleoside phosphorylase [Pseudoalteromonas sp. GAB2316C]MDC9571002.1 purine-nucleoside phosphorylase [Pseudoalteromonas sp. GABNB9D]MDC9575185.1 purine-nucleoside phosphorylase [Pseudoalteromonas sp. GABNS16A]MDC9579492.1 purine-nucleoside phosphorylase [Pseudoalteromonas sp. GABNS16E]MDC9587209.1 purine-nucleoside phosphorylase [Pseudoalteromonas sp. GABNS16C]